MANRRDQMDFTGSKKIIQKLKDAGILCAWNPHPIEAALRMLDLQAALTGSPDVKHDIPEELAPLMSSFTQGVLQDVGAIGCLDDTETRDLSYALLMYDAYDEVLDEGLGLTDQNFFQMEEINVEPGL
jgi:hypothetical protein